MESAASIRTRARELEVQLNRLERHDWPRWLREADELSRRITEMRREATALELSQRPGGQGGWSLA